MLDETHLELGREIQNLLKRIEVFGAAIEESKQLLRVAQSHCSHPDMHLYKGQKIGVCAVCLFEGPTRTQIDLREIGLGPRPIQ